MDNARDEAWRVCEDFLQDTIRNNTQRGIAPSETAVAQRMLARGEELRRFYEEIYPRLNHDGITWKHALDCALYVGRFWTPEDIADRRAGRKELGILNEAIAHQADALADLLDRRNELYEQSGFGAETHYAIYEVIDEASERNGHYQGWVKEPLQLLGGRFDLKYWPSLSECIRVIGRDAARADIVADDDLTEAATQSKRPSRADSLRALLAAIEMRRGEYAGAIPHSFEFSNAALADLINVLFELPADDLVNDDYVKTQRHRFNLHLASEN
jgi:hypothetical protein